MYELKPYFAGVVVKPANIMYYVPSYHQRIETVTHSGDVAAHMEHSSVNDIVSNILNSQERMEQTLLENQISLLNLLSVADKRISDFVSKSNAEKKSSAKEKVGKASKQKNEKSQKAGKPEKQCAPIPENTNKLTAEPELVYITRSTYPLRRYNNDRSLKEFLNQSLALFCANSDLQWVELLGKVGAVWGMTFSTCSKKNDHPKVSVAVHISDNAEVKLELPSKMFVTGRVAIWKFMGTLVGLLPESGVDSNTEKWLSWASDGLTDQLTRELCRRLAANDFLCDYDVISLADIVLRSLFATHNQLLKWTEVNAANNVQLWVKRLDESLSI